MRFLLVFLSLAIAIADDLFSPDPPLDAPSLLWNDLDEFDTTGDLAVSDSSLPVASSDFPEQEISSCLGESSDLLSWSRLRARDGKQCSASDQPVPFKGSLPGWAEDLGQKFKEMFGFSSEEEEEEVDPNIVSTLMDGVRCEPTHPFHLCCLERGSHTAEIFMGIEAGLFYLSCRKCLLSYSISRGVSLASFH